MSNPPASQLGPYVLLEPLGKGGMGEVWKARDTRLNRIVAIKRLTAQHSARFEQEARAIAALNHPNICTLHDIGPDYLVMEHVEGAPLAGPLPVDDVVRLGIDIAGALAEAHAKGILHRDLKPANILVTPRGSVKLLDFGLAKMLTSSDDLTQTIEGAIAGTVSYMSPEQARGEGLDPRSDVFSFGAVLYEMLTGRRAFDGGSTTDTLSAVLRDEPSAFHAPPELERIVRRCLRKTRVDRYASISEVRAALDAIRPAAAPGRVTQSQPSIAVLPFANMSRGEDDEYFSDGLAEEIINLLAQMPGLKVIARTSAFAFKGKNEDIRKIADALGVTTVLEGSVRRAGSRIRVTAQLILAEDGTHLWSQRYDREMTDVFTMQDEMAAAIADALKLKLVPLPERRMPSVPAYEAYLRYRYYQWRFTPEATLRSRECLEQALALDPTFALPYVGLADSYLAQAAIVGLSSHDAMPRARELALRALEIDPELAEAHAMIGIVAGQYDYDWEEAGRRFRRAVAREPLSPHLRSWYSWFYLLAIGQTLDARTQADRVIDDDPLGQMWHFCHAFVLQSLGLDDEALVAGRRSVELDPHLWVGWLALGLLEARRGRHDEALRCAEKATADAPWSPLTVGLMAGALENVGRTEEASTLLDSLSGEVLGASFGRAYCALCRGNVELAIEWMTRAADDRTTGLITLMVRPFESICRESPAWPALLKKLNLAAAAAH